MGKNIYVWVAVGLVLVALIAGVAAFEMGLLPGMGKGAANTVTPGLQGDNTGRVTALQALSIAENDAGVAKWKAGVSNVLITGIAADSCEQGLSRIWRVTYSASGGKEATVEVLDGSVKNINTTVTQIPGPGAGLTVQGLLDSDAASRIAVEEMGKADNAPSGPGSFEVWPGTQGAPVWQITYPIEGGYYIFRIDARLGNMIGGALFHTG